MHTSFMSQSDSVIDSLNYCTLVAIQTQTVCTIIQSELQLRGGGQGGCQNLAPSLELMNTVCEVWEQD